MMTSGEWLQIDEVFPSVACLLIDCQEILAIIVSCKIWSHKWNGRRIGIHCDHLVSVTVMNAGRTKDEVLQSCLWVL